MSNKKTEVKEQQDMQEGLGRYCRLRLSNEILYHGGNQSANEEVILVFKNLAGHKVGLKLPPPKSEDCAVFKIEDHELKWGYNVRG